MSAQNLCVSSRNSWIPPARAISSPASATLLEAPEFIACPGGRGKFQGLRKKPREGGGGRGCYHPRTGIAEPDSTPKM